jgi:hypothetical protein
MIHITVAVNTPVTVTILNPAGTTASPPTDVTTLLNGAITTATTITTTDLGVKGLYNMAFTPQATGTFVIYAYGSIVAQVEIVTTTVYSFLQDIKDEALGSWSWNKTAGTLTVLRQDGTTVVDNLTTASRELVS